LSWADPQRTIGGVRDPITALERAIRSLPAATRAAMLEGIREHPIVCGQSSSTIGLRMASFTSRISISFYL
jgi:hypothetical protein